MAGKTTFLRLDWKDWKEKQPKSGQRVYVILRLERAYLSLTGIYLDEILPANGPFIASRWQRVEFDDPQIPDTFLESEEDWWLIAWAVPKIVKIKFIKNQNCTL